MVFNTSIEVWQQHTYVRACCHMSPPAQMAAIHVVWGIWRVVYTHAHCGFMLDQAQRQQQPNTCFTKFWHAPLTPTQATYAHVWPCEKPDVPSFHLSSPSCQPIAITQVCDMLSIYNITIYCKHIIVEWMPPHIWSTRVGWGNMLWWNCTVWSHAWLNSKHGVVTMHMPHLHNTLDSRGSSKRTHLLQVLLGVNKTYTGLQ